MKDPVIIINGAEVLEVLDTEYEHQQYQWELKCREVEGQFRKKTSRSVKNGKEYEYTGWYKLKPGGGLESIGKDAPDFKKYYPPEPKRKYSFQRGEFEGHLIISGEDYKANGKLFKGCLAFRLEDCQNFGHSLYRNPDKIIHPFSVRKGGVSSGTISDCSGTENEDTKCSEPGCISSVPKRFIWMSGAIVDGAWYCPEHSALRQVEEKRRLKNLKIAEQVLEKATHHIKLPKDCKSCELKVDYPECDTGCPVLETQ